MLDGLDSLTSLCRANLLPIDAGGTSLVQELAVSCQVAKAVVFVIGEILALYVILTLCQASIGGVDNRTADILANASPCNQTGTICLISYSKRPDNT